jgi:hypothetical protein
VVVAETRPLRTIGIASGALGVLAIESSGVSGPWAVVGGVLVSVALAAFDGLDRGTVGRRQAGLALTALATALATWAGAVLTFLTLLELPAGSHLTILLAGSLVGLVAGLFLLRTSVEEPVQPSRASSAGVTRPQRRAA